MRGSISVRQPQQLLAGVTPLQCIVLTASSGLHHGKAAVAGDGHVNRRAAPLDQVSVQ